MKENELTLYDIMGQDMCIIAKLDGPTSVSVEVLDEDDGQVYCDKSHIYAWDSLVLFARQVIHADERIQRELEEF